MLFLPLSVLLRCAPIRSILATPLSPFGSEVVKCPTRLPKSALAAVGVAARAFLKIDPDSPIDAVALLEEVLPVIGAVPAARGRSPIYECIHVDDVHARA